MRRMKVFVEEDLEAEQHVVGIKRLAVRKTDAMTKREAEVLSVRRDFPRFGERRFRLLRKAVDMNQVTDGLPDDGERWRVHRSDGIESLRFGVE